MTLAVGIWEGRGGCDFWGLGANVVGVGREVRWESDWEGGVGGGVGGVSVGRLGSGRRRDRCGEEVLVVVCMTSLMSLFWKTVRVTVR
jgi:hypothetical protein